MQIACKKIKCVVVKFTYEQMQVWYVLEKSPLRTRIIIIISFLWNGIFNFQLFTTYIFPPQNNTEPWPIRTVNFIGSCLPLQHILKRTFQHEDNTCDYNKTFKACRKPIEIPARPISTNPVFIFQSCESVPTAAIRKTPQAVAACGPTSLFRPHLIPSLFKDCIITQIDYRLDTCSSVTAPIVTAYTKNISLCFLWF